jgi:hypothetical protein
MRPTIAPVMDKEAQLRDQYLRAGLCDSNVEIVFQFGRAHQVTHQLSKFVSPLGSIHARLPLSFIYIL